VGKEERALVNLKTFKKKFRWGEGTLRKALVKQAGKIKGSEHGGDENQGVLVQKKNLEQKKREN